MNFNDIKVAVVDVDGTLSDGTYQVFETGHFSKTFYTRDFDAISQLLKNGIKVIIITTSHDVVILRQMRRISRKSSMADLWKEWQTNRDLIVITKSGNKKKRLTNLLLDMGLGWNNVAYIGDAENDIECMKVAAFSGCPSDAIEEIKDIALYPSIFPGGHGAVYDFCTYILKKRKENK